MSVMIRILGSIAVVADGVNVHLGDRKHRIFIAILALEGRCVEKRRLVELLWGEEHLPQDPDGQLHVYATRLRKALDEASPGRSAVLRTLPRIGYELDRGAVEIDVVRFRRLAAQARAALDREPRTAARLGRAALAEWGDPAGVRGGTPLEAVEPQLERITEGLRQEYQAALMACLRAELCCGMHQELLPELARLASYDGYGEENQELARIRMLAAYRAGNKTDALDIYQKMHDVLDLNLGIEPDPETRKLKKQILTDDSELQLPETEQPNSEEPEDPSAVETPIGRRPTVHQRAHTINNIDQVHASEVIFGTVLRNSSDEE
jgi:DNA-binding SARP family transcriptional activator